MKKLPIFLLLLFFSIFLWAQNETDDFELNPWDSIDNIKDDFELNPWDTTDTETAEEKPKEVEVEADTKKEKRLKNRTVELSLMNINVGFSNNFISAADFFRNPFYLLSNIKDIIDDPILVYHKKPFLNLDDFFKGFKFNIGVLVKPVSLNFNHKDQWGFGLDIGHVNVMGNLFLSGDMMTFNQGKDKFGAGGAAFADVGIPVFFPVKDFKIKIRPSVYLPIIYAEPNVNYTGQDGSRFGIDYNMRVYTLVGLGGKKLDVDGMQQDLQNNIWNILRENLGYDFGLSIEYPWNEQLDIGVDFVNIPVPYASASLNHYMQIKGEAWIDFDKLDIADLLDKGKNIEDILAEALSYPDKFDITYGYTSKGKKIYRPFAMLFYANYRPFDSRVLSLIPSLGFSISHLYPEIGSIEGGLNTQFDFRNIFLTTLGWNYNNRQFRNSVDFVLNLRALELDFGLSAQSQDFIKCWQGAGLAVNFGIKLGW